MVDVFRHLHGYGDLETLDVSYATETENPASVPLQDVDGKQFDHMMASEELNPAECRYVQAGFTCSNHAALVAEFTG